MSIFCDSNSISQWWFFFFSKKESSLYTIVKLINQAFLLLSKKITVPVTFSTYGLLQNMSIDEMKIQPYLK